SELDKTSVVAQAVAELAERAAEQSPTTAGELWLSLGGFVEQQGELAEAARWYTRALATGHKQVECLRALERVCEPTGDLETLARGLELFVSGQAEHESPALYTEALYRLGGMRLERGDHDAGARHLEAALERDLAAHTPE